MAISFSKKDITRVLAKTNNEILLNPSIAHWKDDLFLCSYRVYIRYPGLNTSEYVNDPISNPNHPWLGGDKSTTWWQSKQGYDQTRLSLLRIRGKSVDKIETYGEISGVDARLIKIDPDRFVILLNVWIRDKNIRLKRTDCKKGCMLIIARVITMTDTNELALSKGLVLCPKRAERIEKNWTCWMSPEGELMVSYGITLNHEVFRLQVINDKVSCVNISSIRGRNKFFKNLSKYYRHACFDHFPWCTSTSTPAVRMSNGNYLGVGHFKYDYKHALMRTNKNTYLYRFTEMLRKKKKKFHPRFVYLMFLYEFSATAPYSILRTSDMFIPKSSNFALAFPAGLTHNPDDNNYIISYGDHDTECWLLFMTERQIDKALREITNPADLKFLLV
jgi:hypothetical protein